MICGKLYVHVMFIGFVVNFVFIFLFFFCCYSVFGWLFGDLGSTKTNFHESTAILSPMHMMAKNLKNLGCSSLLPYTFAYIDIKAYIRLVLYVVALQITDSWYRHSINLWLGLCMRYSNSTKFECVCPKQSGVFFLFKYRIKRCNSANERSCRMEFSRYACIIQLKNDAYTFAY